jgi:predicted nucleic acid-binding protein
MRTAVDSSVIFDVVRAEPVFGPGSRQALRRAYDNGALVACEVVWAEVRAHYADDTAFEEVMALLGVAFDPMGAPAAAVAGRLWRSSRSPRSRLLADFLIGSHALVQADALLTRDDGFYRKHFRGLRVVGTG